MDDSTINDNARSTDDPAFASQIVRIPILAAAPGGDAELPPLEEGKRARNPYKGPVAFSSDDSQQGKKLYGRDRETADLVDLLISQRIVLLYSPSGAGKTSLVQAKLIPSLEEEGFFIFPAMRVNRPVDPGSTFTPRNPYIYSILTDLDEGLETPHEELAGLTLNEYLDRRHEGETEDGFVLLFDQFEEILTVDPHNYEAKVDFFQQVGEALRRQPRRRALFAMREDYVSAMDPYLEYVPTHFRNSYRLDLLDHAAAMQAIQFPARDAGVRFTNNAARKLLTDLTAVSVVGADGKSQSGQGRYVEPVQLQVVCQTLWEEQAPVVGGQIQEENIPEGRLVDEALRTFYDNAVRRVAQQSRAREGEIRLWVGEELITPQGIRGQVMESRGEQRSAGLLNTAISGLVDTYLVRGERRRGVTWYELAHDRLIRPVLDSNAFYEQSQRNRRLKQYAVLAAGVVLALYVLLIIFNAVSDRIQRDPGLVCRTALASGCRPINFFAEDTQNFAFAVGTCQLGVDDPELAPRVADSCAQAARLSADESAERQAEVCRTGLRNPALATEVQGACSSATSETLTFAIEVCGLGLDDARAPEALSQLRVVVVDACRSAVTLIDSESDPLLAQQVCTIGLQGSALVGDARRACSTASDLDVGFATELCGLAYSDRFPPIVVRAACESAASQVEDSGNTLQAQQVCGIGLADPQLADEVSAACETAAAVDLAFATSLCQRGLYERPESRLAEVIGEACRSATRLAAFSDAGIVQATQLCDIGRAKTGQAENVEGACRQALDRDFTYAAAVCQNGADDEANIEGFVELACTSAARLADERGDTLQVRSVCEFGLQRPDLVSKLSEACRLAANRIVDNGDLDTALQYCEFAAAGKIAVGAVRFACQSVAQSRTGAELPTLVAICGLGRNSTQLARSVEIACQALLVRVEESGQTRDQIEVCALTSSNRDLDEKFGVICNTAVQGIGQDLSGELVAAVAACSLNQRNIREDRREALTNLCTEAFALAETSTDYVILVSLCQSVQDNPEQGEALAGVCQRSLALAAENEDAFALRQLCRVESDIPAIRGVREAACEQSVAIGQGDLAFAQTLQSSCGVTSNSAADSGDCAASLELAPGIADDGERLAFLQSFCFFLPLDQALIPGLRSACSAAVDLSVELGRTSTILELCRDLPDSSVAKDGQTRACEEVTLLAGDSPELVASLCAPYFNGEEAEPRERDLCRTAVENTGNTVALTSACFLFTAEPELSATFLAGCDRAVAQATAEEQVLLLDGICTQANSEYAAAQTAACRQVEALVKTTTDPFILVALCAQRGDETLCRRAQENAVGADAGWYTCAALLRFTGQDPSVPCPAARANLNVSADIVPGASVTAELAPFHGRTWTFSGSAGQLIQIAMERTAGTLDSYLYLFGPDGTMVAQDDDSGGELNAFLLHVLESDGIYTILAAEMFGSQGTFELRLEQPEEPDPFTLARLCLQDGDEALCAQAAATADSAWYLCALLQSNDFAPAESACARAGTLATPPIDFGNPVAGTLSPFQGAARTFFGTAGQRVRISMSASTDSALDSFLYLLGPDGELVAANDDGGGGESGLDSLLELVLPVTGRYTIVAADIYETAGQYLLLLEILE